MRIVSAQANPSASSATAPMLSHDADCSRSRLHRPLPAVILAILCLLLLAGSARDVAAQTTTFADPAVPVALVPSAFYSQVYVLNQDRTVSEFATENIQNLGYSCTAAPGLAAQTTTPHTLAYDGVLYEIGPSSANSSFGVVGISTPNYNGCKYSPVAVIPGNPVTVAAAVGDPRYHRLVVLTQDGGNTADKLTGFDTSQFYFSGTALLPLGQASLDQGAQYTALVTDFDGLGDTVITELSTPGSPGNLWIYNPATGTAMKVLAPGGGNLPALNAFILHNPNNLGGGLLVLANQDGLTAANAGAPPIDTTPFSIIDLGQLHTLIAAQPAATTSVTLPFITTISATLPYYAMLGAAYNPINHLLYAVVGGGTSDTDVFRNVISYDPTSPSSPAETVVADVTAIPIIPPAYPQLALSAASGTLQFLLADPSAVYSVGITAGATNAVTQISGASFPNDPGFQPTAMAAHGLVGDTYIASQSGYVDTLTLTTGAPHEALLDLTGSLIQATVGDDSSVGLYGYFYETSDTSLSNTQITVTATPVNPTGPQFTFAMVPSIGARGGTSVDGTFTRAGLYTLVASFPGDSFFAPAVSSPVNVSVAEPPLPTQISLTASAFSATAALVNVTLTGTNYTPTGTITVIDAVSGLTIGTHTLAGALVTPISFYIALASTTSSVQASYSGDTLNQPSTSIPFSLGPAPQKTTLSISGPATGAKESTSSFTILLTSAGTVAPTGTITVTATLQGTTTSVQLHSEPASAAFVAPGAILNFNPSFAGTTIITATYPGDTNYLPSSASTTIVVAGSPSTLVLTVDPNASTANPFNVSIAMNTVDNSVPTGNITLTAQLPGSPAVTEGTAPALAAVQSGGALIGVGVTVPGTYTFTATYPGDANFAPATGTTTKTVTGISNLSLFPTSLSFVATPPATSAPQTVTYTNNGSSSLNLYTISITGTGFAQTNNCPPNLAPKAFCTVTVTFTPAAPGTFTGVLGVLPTGFPEQDVPLTGTGVGFLTSVSPASAIFIDQTVGTTTVHPQVFTVTNGGTLPLAVTNIVINDTDNFDVHDMNCRAQSPLAAGATCQFNATFHPLTTEGGTAELITGQLQLFTSDPAFTGLITVSGQALAPGACLDSDSDGLCDDWENNGVYVHVKGQTDKFIDLPSMGADSMHKDIFLHIDYMANDPAVVGSHSDRPKLAAMAALQANFATAPVKNPDLKPGIQLHIDCGSDCIMNPVTGALWGMASKATALAETTTMDTVDTPGGVFTSGWTEFDSLSTAFNATGRSLAFHHVIFAHNLWTNNSTSGISRNGADVTTGASDLVVALGSWPTPGGTAIEQAGTLYHELGHNLGLLHGGRDAFNRKPNHLSVMNYNFQTVGMILDGKSGDLDYSEFALPSIDELALLEPIGIGADPKVYLPTVGKTLDHFGTFWYCTGDDFTKVSPHQTTTIDSNVDWNCKLPIIAAPVVQDININGQYDASFVSVQEWPILQFSGGAIGANGAGPAAPSAEPELNNEEASLNVPLYGVSVTSMGIVTSAPGNTTTMRYVVQNVGQTADMYNLASSSELGWAGSGPSITSLSLAPGASAEVDITYTVPAGTATGTTDLLILKASSVNDTYIQDTAQVSIYATATPNPLSISTALLTFGTQATGGTSKTGSVVVTNTGTSSVTFSGISTTAEFAETNSCGTTLAVGASCSIAISFTPAATGVRTGTLTIDGSGLSAPLTAGLQGSAVKVNNLPRPVISLTVTPASSFTGQTVSIVANLAGANGAPVPTGNVTFTSGSDGTTILGQAAVDGSGNATLNLTSLSPGTYGVFAQYPGDTAYNLGSSPVQQFTVSSTAATATALSVSGTTVQVGASLSLSATVTSSAGVPTGSLSFLDGTIVLGTATLNSSGVGTLSVSTLALGTHSLTALYIGSGVFAQSVSGVTQVVVVLAPDYSVAASPTTLTIVHGKSGSVEFTVTPINNYQGAISLSCGTLPADMSCSFSPAQTTFTTASQSPQTVTLLIDTTQTVASLHLPASKQQEGGILALVFWLPGSLLSIFALRKKAGKRRLRGIGLLLFLLVACGLFSLSGCISSAPTTPAGKYTVPIDITDGTINHSMNFTVVVQ
jgi:hypothetical protein